MIQEWARDLKIMDRNLRKNLKIDSKKLLTDFIEATKESLNLLKQTEKNKIVVKGQSKSFRDAS